MTIEALRFAGKESSYAQNWEAAFYKFVFPHVSIRVY